MTKGTLSNGMKTCVAVLLLSATLAASAQAVLDEGDFRGGVIAYVGCGDADLLAGLGGGEGRIVHAIDADPAKVDAARRKLADRGMSGTVAVGLWTGRSLPYADNFVNLLVLDDAPQLELKEVLRVLAPRGVALARAADGEWTKTVKAWPAEMDEWTHWEHAADGNPVSRDTLVGPPREMQWTDGPAWSKKHWGPRLSALASSGGRLFLVQDETPTSLFNIDARWVLTARDAFNGVILWQRELPRWNSTGWGRVTPRADNPPPPEGLILGVWGDLGGGGGIRDATRVMVADFGRLYLPLEIDAPLSMLDAATGEVLKTYGDIAPVQEVVLAQGVLLVASGGKTHAIDAASGKLLWQHPGGGFCTDGTAAYLIAERGRSLAAVDLKEGRPLWHATLAEAAEKTGLKTADASAMAGSLTVGAGVVLAGVKQGRDSQTLAFSAADGRPLWRHPFGGKPFGKGSTPFFIDGQIWSLDSGRGRLLAMDPRTGKVLKESPVESIRYVGHHARCYYARATGRYILAKERGADFVDLTTGEVSWNNWVRGPCHRGVIPANGLIYAGQHSCRCYTEAALHGFHALAPARSSRASLHSAAAADSAERLQRGGAYDDRAAASTASADDWPAFRHDATRSGASPTSIAADLNVAWSVDLPKPLTAPVAADGRVYLAAVDAHTLYAIDAGSGRKLWQYRAGGRIDSPPTIHNGLALFGSRDGWVYCLRADDGRLVWRFRAAPAERMVGADGQLESAWPVPGSILVHEGLAYCTAGRSSFLDGGLFVYAIDAASGRVLHERHLDGPWPGPEVGSSTDTPNRGFYIEGALPDVMVADGENVYLRHLRFDRTLAKMDDMELNYHAATPTSPERGGGDHKYYDDHVEAPRKALFTNPAWFHRSFFNNFPGRRLYASTGLLDDSWHRRMYWASGQVVGQYIVFRGEMGYAVQVFATSPREGGMNAGDGYVIYAGQTAERESDEKLFALRPDQSRWRLRLPLRPVAMALAGETLVVAGAPDAADPTEALAAVEGKRGGLLWLLSAADGARLAEHRLPAAPAYEGLAVARGKLFLVSADGRLQCLTSR